MIQNADMVVPKATRKVASVMQPARHLSEAEEHDPEERRLEEEGGQYFVGQRAGPANVARHVP